ncbi:hypothetical protein F4806DRAFT_362656 [Annulohypoxylon nitens]|nr:hypothetical protein F4806DRAFT_362656 [Annulohypoxylon nitens]
MGLMACRILLLWGRAIPKRISLACELSILRIQTTGQGPGSQIEGVDQPRSWLHNLDTFEANEGQRRDIVGW